ncbi:MAG: Na(+)/H(+) antiporter subunit B [Alphaproteobacteria bacterium]
MKEHLVLRVIAKLLIPFILLFGLYVQLHGDHGPGGGFQAGVIFASAFILYALIFGVRTARRVAPLAIVTVFVSLGLLLYAGVGVVAMLKGGNYLEYAALAGDPVEGNHLGVLLIELGVGITVAAVMVTIYFVFADRRG